MRLDKIDSFNEKGITLFQPSLEKYGYELDQVIINYLNGKTWSAFHNYVNNKINLKIEIRQQPYYTDYGFSFFIYKLGTDEYDLLYNIPHERQDSEDKFLIESHDKIFSNPEIVEIISGISWKGQEQFRSNDKSYSR